MKRPLLTLVGTRPVKRIGVALLWVALVTVGSACAGSARPGTASSVDHNTLKPEEFGQRPFNSAFEAIESLRPNWLYRRGSESDVQVYVDDTHLGGQGELRTIRLSSVAVIRHLDGIQATARYGLGHDNGAILVTTRAAGR